METGEGVKYLEPCSSGPMWKHWTPWKSKEIVLFWHKSCFSMRHIELSIDRMALRCTSVHSYSWVLYSCYFIIAVSVKSIYNCCLSEILKCCTSMSNIQMCRKICAMGAGPSTRLPLRSSISSESDAKNTTRLLCGLLWPIATEIEIGLAR